MVKLACCRQEIGWIVVDQHSIADAEEGSP